LAVKSNEEWLGALRGSGLEHQQAIEELGETLKRGLRYALSSYGKVRAEDIDDFAQDAVLRVLDKLGTFQGRSRFTTWAHKVAVHIALSELRRRRWRDVPLLPPKELSFNQEAPVDVRDEDEGPEERTIRREMMRLVSEAIDNDLTDRQRQAMVAIVMQGMPLGEVAAHMDTNANALYKLLHDARKRLKRRLTEAGMPPEDILAAFQDG